MIYISASTYLDEVTFTLLYITHFLFFQISIISAVFARLPIRQLRRYHHRRNLVVKFMFFYVFFHRVF